MPEPPDDPSRLRAASALSGHLDTRTAATEVAHAVHDDVAGGADLAILFASYHHRAALPEAVDIVRQTLDPTTTLAVTTEGVVGREAELEGVVGMSLLAMRAAGMRLTPWHGTPDDPVPVSRPGAIAERIGAENDSCLTIMIGDPFSTPITRLLPALGRALGTRPLPVVGGMASGASKPGRNALVLDDRLFNAGVIGVTIKGAVGADIVVSQGCRPVGQPLRVTEVERNVVKALDGEPAMAKLREVADGLSFEERELVQKGLLLGTAIDDAKRHVGRGDFLVRNVLGFEQETGGVVVGDVPTVDQTVQFHLRDAIAATEDLQLLLDAQVLAPPPAAGLLFTCNGRGQRLFGEPNHDVDVIASRLGAMPLAGFLAAGEIGPIGDQSFLHGHTAVLALFRDA